jgi:DNA-binding transcriptional LysR family regulator
MRTEQLDQVATIARLGSFRRAAEELHVSQAALSATVRKLERELGIEILNRGRSGTQVSDEGRELLPHIAEVLDAVERLQQVAKRQHGTPKVVRVGAVNSGAALPVIAIASEFRRLHTSTRVEISIGKEASLRAALREGSIDVALTTHLSDEDVAKDLDTAVLERSVPGVCVSSDSVLARTKSVGSAVIRSEPLVIMEPGYLMHRYVYSVAGGRPVNIAYTTDDSTTGKMLVAQGLGSMVLPEFALADDQLAYRGRITWRPLVDDRANTTEVLLIAQRRHTGNPPGAVRDLYQLLANRAGAMQRRLASRLNGLDDQAPILPGFPAPVT